MKVLVSDISFQIINGVLSEKKVEWSYEYFCDVVAAEGIRYRKDIGKE